MESTTQNWAIIEYAYGNAKDYDCKTNGETIFIENILKAKNSKLTQNYQVLNSPIVLLQTIPPQLVQFKSIQTTKHIIIPFADKSWYYFSYLTLLAHSAPSSSSSSLSTVEYQYENSILYLMKISKYLHNPPSPKSYIHLQPVLSNEPANQSDIHKTLPTHVNVIISSILYFTILMRFHI